MLELKPFAEYNTLMKKEIMLLALCAFFVTYVPLANYDKLNTSSDVAFFVLKSAYGQTPDPGSLGTDPGSPDANSGSNSTGISTVTDPSSESNSGSGISNPNDTALGGPDTTIPDASSNFGNAVNGTAGTNETVNHAVPEFGPISALILTTAIVSIVLITTRTGLSSRFHQ